MRRRGRPKRPREAVTTAAPPGLALGLLCAAQFMMVLDASIVAVALPSLRRELGLDESSLQYVLSLYALTSAAC